MTPLNVAANIAVVLAFVLDHGMSPINGQELARKYQSPGHRWLGVYASGSERHFDFQLRRIELPKDIENKAAWWKELHEQRSRLAAARSFDIFLVSCREKENRVEDSKRLLDDWLQPERDCPTYPELIPGICLGEENVPGQNSVLGELAAHIRSKFGIPVFQWYTEPLPPDLSLLADGWIWDSYGWDSQRFRKHAMKFAVLDKPVISVVWATDPNWNGGTAYTSAAELIDREWKQLDICREFNIPCAAFAVSGRHGSVADWESSPGNELSLLRNHLAMRREAMHRSSSAPLPSANLASRDRAVPIGGDKAEPHEFEESFETFDWLHDCDIRGFTYLRQPSAPAKIGSLELISRSGQSAAASLTYCFESWLPLQSIEIELDGSTSAECKSELSIELLTEDSPSARAKLVRRMQGGDKGRLELKDDVHVAGLRTVFLRVAMRGDAGRGDRAIARLDCLRVRSIHQAPGRQAALDLRGDENGIVQYVDDFRTNRWKYFGTAIPEHPTHGGFRDGYFWVGLKGGAKTKTQFSQRIHVERPLAQLEVVANCYADEANLAGSCTLAVVAQGQSARWQKTTSGRIDGPFGVTIPGSDLGDLQDFELQVTLNSNSGVEQGDKAAARLSGIRIKGRLRD